MSDKEKREVLEDFYYWKNDYNNRKYVDNLPFADQIDEYLKPKKYELTRGDLIRLMIMVRSDSLNLNWNTNTSLLKEFLKDYETD
jgi:hypothetical protein